MSPTIFFIRFVLIFPLRVRITLDRCIHSVRVRIFLTNNNKEEQLLTVFQDLAKLHICLQAPEECHSESMTQRVGFLKPEQMNIIVQT